MARAPRSHLQIHLPDAWRPAAEEDVPVRWSRHAGVRVEDGADRLRDLAPADEVTVVVPAARVAFVQARLPAMRGAALAKLLPYAVEDALFCGPESIHAVVVTRAPDGDALIAVIDREWFAAMLDALRACGLAPGRAIAESALVPAGGEGEWTVVWSERGGFLCRDGPETLALDAATDLAPPVALRLALQEARRDGAPPSAIRVYTTSALAAPDPEAWSAALRVPVSARGRWTPEAYDARRLAAADLLVDAFAVRGRETAALRRYAPALAIAGLAAAIHVGLSVADWTRLALEERALRTAMAEQFRASFPGAQVVDPALQMSRNLAELRRAAGEPHAGDALPLLARAAAPLAASGRRIEALRYQPGQLEIDLAAAGAASPGSLQALLRSHAPELRTSAALDGARGGTTLRITPGGR
jgi:general secretion pathway protein L